MQSVIAPPRQQLQPIHLTELSVHRADMPPKKKVMNEVLYWYQYHLKGTGIGAGIGNSLNDTQP